MSSETAESLAALLKRVRACQICKASLPLGARPVLRVSATARILIVGQAPGTRVHETGIPWNDPSGDRLRKWLQISREDFYDETKIAIIPMGYCYPGRYPKGGDLPPRKECAEHWLPLLLPRLPELKLTLLIGGYAQEHYLGSNIKKSLTETVRAWREYAPEFIPLPHPSFRNLLWLKQNPWFEQEVTPMLRERVHAILETFSFS
jgi:uracil-DNA glycosylase